VWSLAWKAQCGKVSQNTAKKSARRLLQFIAEGAGKMPASKRTKDEQKRRGVLRDH
jgi:hypothetical protein